MASIAHRFHMPQRLVPLEASLLVLLDLSLLVPLNTPFLVPVSIHLQAKALQSCNRRCHFQGSGKSSRPLLPPLVLKSSGATCRVKGIPRIGTVDDIPLLRDMTRMAEGRTWACLSLEDCVFRV